MSFGQHEMTLPPERKSSLPLDSLPLKISCLSWMLCAFYPPANSKITRRTDQSQSKAMSTFESVEFLRSFVIFLDFHSTKQGLSLVDSWSRGLDKNQMYPDSDTLRYVPRSGYILSMWSKVQEDDVLPRATEPPFLPALQSCEERHNKPFWP